MSGTTVTDGAAVEVEELTVEQGRAMLEATAQDRFGVSWDEFFRSYQGGEYVGTERAREAEELAFLAPFAG
jgi:hypothetical protein